VFGGGGADDVAVAPQAGVVEPGEDFFGVAVVHLDHRPQFFGEQGGDGVVLGEGGEVDVQTQVAGEGHLRQGGQEPAVGAVVVGAHEAAAVEVLNRLEEGLEELRVVQVRWDLAHGLVHLGEGRGADAVAPLAQVDEDEVGLDVSGQHRGEGAADVVHRGEGGDVEGQGGDHRPLLAVFVAPHRLHGQGVLAHRDADAETRAQLQAHGAHGVVEGGVGVRPWPWPRR